MLIDDKKFLRLPRMTTSQSIGHSNMPELTKSAILAGSHSNREKLRFKMEIKLKYRF